MTKILCVTTGQYLKFNSRDAAALLLTEVELENVCGTPLPEVEIDCIIHMDESEATKCKVWFDVNGLKWPVLKEELEIVYD